MYEVISLAVFIAAFVGAYWLISKLIRRWVHEESLITGKSKKPKDPIHDSSAKRLTYIESIRWKGEIYCQACGSTLKRVPVARDWFNTPTYNPMTGAALSQVEMYGPTGLMVCEKYDDTRMSSGSGFRLPSPQQEFAEMLTTRHGMYYTDKPPIET